MKPIIAFTHDFLISEFGKKKSRYSFRKIKSLSSLPQQKNVSALLIDLTQTVSKNVLKKFPGLKVLATLSAGLNHIDLEECERRKIKIISTPDILTRATAELTVALLYSVAKRIPEGESFIRSGQFQGWQPDLLLGLELKGRRAVLVGKGRIGTEVALLFEANGMKVDFITRATKSAKIRSLLKRAQVLSFHTPLTSNTRHWLDENRLKLLPRDAIVLNTARGAICDEKVLIRALKEKKIFGAGLDVYENEPKISRELTNLKNVTLLPHLGSATLETRQKMAARVASGVLKALEKT